MEEKDYKNLYTGNYVDANTPLKKYERAVKEGNEDEFFSIYYDLDDLGEQLNKDEFIKIMNMNKPR